VRSRRRELTQSKSRFLAALGMTMEPSLLNFGGLGGVSARFVDGMAAEAETKITGVASAAAERTD